MQYEISNPFIGTENYNCFACAPHNSIGLQLRFERDADTVRASWQPSADYQGYSQIVHGGIQATLLDEVASWTIFTLCGVAGLTQQMHIEYEQALPLNAGIITAVGTVQERTKRTVSIACHLCIGDAIYTRSTAEFRIIPSQLATRSFSFPDPASFHAQHPDTLQQ